MGTYFFTRSSMGFGLIFSPELRVMTSACGTGSYVASLKSCPIGSRGSLGRALGYRPKAERGGAWSPQLPLAARRHPMQPRQRAPLPLSWTSALRPRAVPKLHDARGSRGGQRQRAARGPAPLTPDAAHDVEELLSVQEAQVPRVHPAVVVHLLPGGGLVVEVPHEDVPAPDVDVPTVLFLHPGVGARERLPTAGGSGQGGALATRLDDSPTAGGDTPLTASLSPPHKRSDLCLPFQLLGSPAPKVGGRWRRKQGADPLGEGAWQPQLRARLGHMDAAHSAPLATRRPQTSTGTRRATDKLKTPFGQNRLLPKASGQERE
ncbi:uncharacterized protein LOC120615438 [Pteropus medius]|uniref:uncharacterized protein LOC120615438 n=1 Tax=Pteropus vampyrus TaxID=132908 RepID=UPI00196B0401|nr:uncharacterized protein LOC120615438 [Pteropus giganteus]